MLDTMAAVKVVIAAVTDASHAALTAVGTTAALGSAVNAALATADLATAIVVPAIVAHVIVVPVTVVPVVVAVPAILVDAIASFCKNKLDSSFFFSKPALTLSIWGK